MSNKGLENLIPFKKGQSGNPSGRPRKFVSALKEQGYKASEVNDAILVLLSMNIDELKDVYNNPQATVLEKTVAAAIRKSIEKGSLYSMETLLARTFGKPKEQVDLNNSGGVEIKVIYADSDKAE